MSEETMAVLRRLEQAARLVWEQGLPSAERPAKSYAKTKADAQFELFRALESAKKILDVESKP